MTQFFVWLTDGTLLTVPADRCRHDRRVMTFERRSSSACATRWREVSVLLWEDVQRVERFENP
ncbi:MULTISPECIES: hypothetical protein [Micromonospora]|uniref:Uncharacterized protein n=1 Tax=Micromonospora solifontis TaxID=2487138 RepID=A0ABX9W8E3_9ACTN|nr:MULTISPECIES: hypothetical protein [Micromonospora]NES16272.1 hypothetical protein [Micromonospora sp. PPF5-17B]NES39691.1 hypothetical protein [Micromonospora solifontis]NES59077.1 hypothetical protein [Micromonospora sp. PPF5-6]RNL87120.1 hypothetical protein EFE23_26840 [Micromonospora solifontis]